MENDAASRGENYRFCIFLDFFLAYSVRALHSNRQYLNGNVDERENIMFARVTLLPQLPLSAAIFFSFPQSNSYYLKLLLSFPYNMILHRKLSP